MTVWVYTPESVPGESRAQSHAGTFGARGEGGKGSKRLMKVILLHEVPNLGKPGDVKDVADGYARNYLLPRQLVAPATPAALANLQQQVASAQRRAEKQRQGYEGLTERLAGVTLTFAVRVGRGDRLYGSVTSQDIANGLQEQEGLTVDRRSIQLRDPIRQIGTFEVPVRVASGFEPKVKVVVQPSETPASEAEAETQPAAEEAETAEAEA
jgi:large subunit ribosomal protein L9